MNMVARGKLRAREWGINGKLQPAAPRRFTFEEESAQPRPWPNKKLHELHRAADQKGGLRVPAFSG